MDVKYLPREQTQSTLIALAESCESMQWAVAWATENAAFEKAMKHSERFEHFVIGTHFFQTHPNVWTCPTSPDGYRLETQAGLGLLMCSCAGLSTGGVAPATQAPTVGNPCSLLGGEVRLPSSARRS